jgi:phospholipase/carboxylesterase
MSLTPLGSLRARIVAPVNPRLTVVLMHGFGAPGDDLVALADVLDLPDVAWVFPEAPLELGGLYGDSRAWWMIDLASLERPTDRSGEIPPGLADARTALLGALDEVGRRFPTPLVLGGFSQGAMLALDVALADTRPLAGLVLMSGTLLARSIWEPRMAARKGLRVLQSHGRVDPLLPYTAAVTLRDLMAAAGMDVSFLEFHGGHEIPPPVLGAVVDFLQS